jgi:hypothetical protein
MLCHMAQSSRFKTRYTPKVQSKVSSGAHGLQQLYILDNNMSRYTCQPGLLAESQPALKVSFNRPRPRSQPAGRVCWLFIFFHGS